MQSLRICLIDLVCIGPTKTLWAKQCMPTWPDYAPGNRYYRETPENIRTKWFYGFVASIESWYDLGNKSRTIQRFPLVKMLYIDLINILIDFSLWPEWHDPNTYLHSASQ